MFLHSYPPSPVFLQIGNLIIYWYGLLIFLAFWLGFFLTLKLAGEQKIDKEKIFNLIFWVFIFGLVGARLYNVFSEFSYYRQRPLEILFFWQGGLGIFGAIIAGVLTIFFYSRQYRLSFFQLLDIFTPALALGLVIGRWGNWFNQEIYGWPTDLLWGIPISPENRLPSFENFTYFHPTFLYESVFCFLLFLFLILRLKKRGGDKKKGEVFALFLIFYSLFRFLNEFLRLDPQPIFLNLRLGQLISIFIFFLASFLILKNGGPDRI